MLIPHKGHTDTIHVYSVTVMTHVKALQAGHSSQGTSEPITPEIPDIPERLQQILRESVPNNDFNETLPFLLVLLNNIESFIDTSHTQFGFKRKHATDLCIYSLKKCYSIL